MTTLLDSLAKRSASPHVLSAIRDEACNLAIWERPANPAFASLLSPSLSDVRFDAPLQGLETRLASELAEAGYRAGEECGALIADMVALAKSYAGLMQINAVSVRLAIVTTDSCRKFHADYVKARLITTYVGTGTQWIDAEDAARVTKDEVPQNVKTLATGDVGLFKGKLWTQTPAIHRSPPIEGTGERRLILVLDPARAD